MCAPILAQISFFFFLNVDIYISIHIHKSSSSSNSPETRPTTRPATRTPVNGPASYCRVATAAPPCPSRSSHLSAFVVVCCSRWRCQPLLGSVSTMAAHCHHATQLVNPDVIDLFTGRLAGVACRPAYCSRRTKNSWMHGCLSFPCYRFPPCRGHHQLRLEFSIRVASLSACGSP